MTPKRILFVSGYFPPFAPVGAVRPPKLAKYWALKGVEVRVLGIHNPDLWKVSGLAGAGGQPPRAPAAGEIRFEHVAADGTGPTIEVAHLPYREPSLFGRRKASHAVQLGSPAPTAPPIIAARSTRHNTGALEAVKQLYRQLLTTPDRYSSWVSDNAVPVATMARTWDADLIYSSGPPQSAHRLASRVAEENRTPWVAELRDLWVGNPYDERPSWLRAYSTRLADQALGRASGFVTISDGLARELRERYRLPTSVAMNGYDSDDYVDLDTVEPLDPDRLTIIHAGVIYAGRRDARPLLEAIAAMEPAERGRITVHFYHDEGAYVEGLVQSLGLGDSVVFHQFIPRRTVLEIERRADVLLLCRWNDPREDSVIPGKLFEYIGARRPILSVGSTTGEAADIVRAGSFGLVSNDPQEIAAQLRRWLAQKPGRLPDLPAAAVEPYDRAIQFEAIDRFLDQFVR